MAVYQWSTTALTNQNSDNNINLKEGQAPSLLNDASRGMMAEIAKYRDDVSGAITATGAISSGHVAAYTIATSQVFTSAAVMDKALICFVPNGNNASPVTLNTDALGSRPLRTAPNAEVAADTLIAGTPYQASFNNTDGAWYLQSFFGLTNSPLLVPIGGILTWPAIAVPSSNWVSCNGQQLSRAIYVTLFATIGTGYGAGNGSTTFNVPDLRGRVPVGVDVSVDLTGAGAAFANRIGTALATDSGTINGQSLGSFGGSASHTLTAAELAAHAHSITDPGHTHDLNVTAFANGTGAGIPIPVSTGAAEVPTPIVSHVTGITTTDSNVQTLGTALLQPTIILNNIIRVL